MPRQIFLFSQIDSFSAEWVIRQLFDLDRQSNEEITIFINSPGGAVQDFFAINDAMRVINSPIRTIVIGMAASCAAVLAAAGDTRLITKDSQFMIHEVWSFMMCSITETGENLDRMKAMQDRLNSILSIKTGKSTDELSALMKRNDKYFTAQQAVQFGLADSIIEDSAAQALKLSEPVNIEGQEFSVGEKEVQILRTGEFIHPNYGNLLITDAVLNTMKENFDNKVRGIDVSIDFTHDNDSGEKPAAFWIKSLEIRVNKDGKGKGLFAKGEFTPEGLKKVSQQEYKYSSADIAINYVSESGKQFPYVLRGGTLTNRPFIKGMDAIKLSEPQQSHREEIKNMNKDALIVALKEHGIDVLALQNQTGTLNTEKTALQNQLQELTVIANAKDADLTKVKAELDKITAKSILDAKEVAFNSLVAEGKVIPAQKAKILAMHVDAAAMNAFYSDAPVVVKMDATGTNAEGDLSLNEAEQSLVNNGTYTKEQILSGRKIVRVPKSKAVKK